MGRKTLESFPNGLPLKNRTNIVLTHDHTYKVPGAVVVHDMDELHEELKKYVATGVGLDTLDDSFFIKQITKTKNGYEVEIAEYLEDYENSMNIEDENQVYDIYIKDLNHNIIATIKSNDGETKSIEVVKENIDKFTTKKIILEKDKNENLYVRQVG